MYILNAYLTALRNKVFKLLPMREASDRGTENHLEEYLEHLYANYAGAFACYPELSTVAEMAEVFNNIAFLKNNRDLDFDKWRSIVLRSTRLVQSVAFRQTEV